MGLGREPGDQPLPIPNCSATPASDKVARLAEQFVQLQRLVARLAPNADLSTMALPFGVAPRRRLARTGSWRGTSYAFATTLLVGANPNSSPFDADFDPHAVPRIRRDVVARGSERR